MTQMLLEFHAKLYLEFHKVLQPGTTLNAIAPPQISCLEKKLKSSLKCMPLVVFNFFLARPLLLTSCVSHIIEE